MSQRTRTRKLTVFLLKESLKSFKQALRRPDSLIRLPLKKELRYEGEFCYSATEPRAPRWQEFINTLLESQISGVNVSTASGVLFIKSPERIFAFTFGYGRHLLKPDCYEPHFGLKVVLNRVSPDRLRSLDMRTYEDVVVTTRRQTSRSAQLAAFGMDIARDLLRAVTGEPNDPEFGKRIAGADSLTINVAVTVDRLGQKCQAIFDAYKDDTYKKHFEWVDNLREAREPIVSELNERLLDCFKEGNTEKLHLAPPEVVDWQSVEKFRITGTGRTEYDDLDIDEYLIALGDKRKGLTVEKLKSYQVLVRWTGSEQFLHRWSLFSCIVWEVEHKDRLYALVEGKWFEIDNNFAGRVHSFVRSLPDPQLRLPSAKAKEREPDYNKRAESECNDLTCLDGCFIKPQDAATQLEFCDLLSKSKHLIYVKRRTRSATLSHLFSQGAVAAEAFLQDGKVREEIRKKLRVLGRGFEALIPDKSNRPNPADYRVVYAIITKRGVGWPGSLPFFSQLSLMQHARHLQGLGFQVALLKIDKDEV